MSDVTLHTGQAITFDFYKITIKEWRSMFEKDEPDEKNSEKVARICGLTLKEFDGLAYPDHFLLMQKFWERARDPLTDPKNSPSVPT
jgi:hypothetical protein